MLYNLESFVCISLLFASVIEYLYQRSFLFVNV